MLGEKWFVSWDKWPWEYYPTYIMGGSYLIAGTAIDSLLAAASTTPFFDFEDVYLSGLCAPKAGVKLLKFERFVIDPSPKYPSPCFVCDTVTWLTDYMHISHKATEKYFRLKQTKCPHREALMRDEIKFLHIY